jgi:methionyl aminopeptidase
MYSQEKNNTLDSLHKASIIHKQVRKYIHPYLKPGVKLVDIAKLIEYKTKQLADTLSIDNNYSSINYGIGFPCCLSLNNIAAHCHPSSNDDKTIYNNDDVFKIDFGTEVNGWIIDSAFTVTKNNIYNNLLKSVKDGVYEGIKTSGVDVNINDWGAHLQELVESYETEYNGNRYPIKIITNLSGHSINKNGVVHGDIRLSPFKTETNLGKMKEGTYAIEILASTSVDPRYSFNLPTKSVEGDTVTLYSLNNNYKFNDSFPFYKKFKYLPFTNRYLTDYGLKELYNINREYVKFHKPLLLPKSCNISHFEHTLYIDDNNKKIVFSIDNDY